MSESYENTLEESADIHDATQEQVVVISDEQSDINDVSSSFTPRTPIGRSTFDERDWHGGVSSMFGGCCS